MVTSHEIDLTNGQLVDTILAQPVQRVFVPCLSAGQTRHATRSNVFKQFARYRGRHDGLQNFIQRAHGKNVEVYAYLNALHWTPHDSTERDDVFQKYPELAERQDTGGFGAPSNGKYASPFNLQVRSELQSIVREVAERYPDLDGLVIQCQLPLGAPLLAFSDASREASSKALGVDALEINLSDSNTPDVAQKWIKWRLSETTALVSELARTFHDKNPRARVAIVGSARWGSLKLGKQNTTLGDWPAWSRTGVVDEVVLEDNWAEVASDTLAQATVKFQGTPGPIATSQMVSVAQIATDLDLQRTIASLRLGAADARNIPIVVAVESSAGLFRAVRFWEELENSSAAKATPALVAAEARPPEQALMLGRPAPNFEVKDMNGRRVRLSDWRGQKNLLLTFFPKCFTSGCEKHLESLQSRRADFDRANTQILAVSADSAATQRAFADMLGLGFAMLPDTQRQVITLYDALDGISGLARRQSVFIDKGGVVRFIERDVHVASHGSDMLAAITKLLNGTTKGP